MTVLNSNRKSKIENRKSINGFTLVELLLAVSLAVVLLALIFSLYLAVSRAVDARRERRDGGAAMVHGMERLSRDLTGALPVPGYDEGGFLLETERASRGSSSRLVFCTTRGRSPSEVLGRRASEEAEAMGLERDPRWFDLVEVVYWLEYQPRERGRLMRSERPLVGPEALEPARTNVLATGVDVFHVHVRSEDEWVDQWEADPDDRETQWPRAARITLEPDEHAQGARALTMDVLIPTGWIIEPTND